MFVELKLNSRYNTVAIQKDMQINEELGIIKILRGFSPITTLAWENYVRIVRQWINCLI